MSQIIVARSIIKSVIDQCTIDRAARLRLNKALKLMHREPPCQHVTGKPQRITAKIRRRIHALHGQHNIHTIANLVGLRNSGRVSEVLRKKR